MLFRSLFASPVARTVKRSLSCFRVAEMAAKLATLAAGLAASLLLARKWLAGRKHAQKREQQKRKIPRSLTIEGERVILKSPIPAETDAELARIFSDPLNMQYLQFLPPPGGFTETSMRARRLMQWGLQEDEKMLNCAYFDQATGKCAGIVGLINMDAANKRCDIGIVIDSPYW